ncbi:motility hub landmark protein FimV [Methylosoma difficile]
MRNLTKTIVVASLMLPVSAYPLGIGDIKLHSALNENLKADISLMLAPGEKPADVKVKLASPEKFIEAGIPWTSVLSDIKFETVAGDNGVVLVKLSTRNALKEPFLDLMLEVTWPKGSLFREFTVLVDPPAVYEQPTIPVANSYDTYQSNPYFPSERPQAVRQQSRSKPRRTAAAVSHDGSLVTSKNDTLWGIAQRVNRGSDASVEQMMIAIYQNNPQAFFKQNVNALMAGKRIKVPDRNTVIQLSRKQALAEFNQQNNAWNNRQVTDVPAMAHSNADSEPDNELTLHAPNQATVADKVEISAESQQTAEAKNTSKPVEVDAGTEDKADTSEPLAGKSGADAEIKAKIAELEKQLATMQQIVALKDQQLAILQNKPQPQPQAQAQQAPVQNPEPVVTPAPVTEAQPQPDTEKPVVAPIKPKPVIKPAQIKPVEPNESYYYLGVIGIGSGLLTVLGWFWFRNRRLDRDSGLDAIRAYTSASKGQTSKPTAELEKAVDNNFGAGSDNLFLAEFIPGEFDTFDMDHDEIDPISEADVYLAYGRYQQAEELMRQAIEDQPDHDEYKLKLLEIYYSNNNSKDFENYAWQLSDTGKKDDRLFWSKVIEMGSEICADSALFNPNGSKLNLTKPSFDVSPAATEPTPAIEEQSVDMFASESFESLIESSAKQEETDVSGELFDFDLSFFEEESNERSGESAENRTVEFELFDEPKPLQQDFAVEDSEPFSTNIIEFDKPSEPKIDASPLSYSFEDEFDFGLLGDDKGKGEIPPPAIDLGNIDEIETKLDLAIAYIDMGDKESAIEIVQEILEKGNDKQRDVAQSLLAGL